MVKNEFNQVENSHDENEKREVDQADELRKLFIEVEEDSDGRNLEDDVHEQLPLREIDVLQLPPRHEVHLPNKRVKLKLSKPLLRLLFVTILIIAVIVSAFLIIGDDLNILGNLN